MTSSTSIQEARLVFANMTLDERHTIIKRDNKICFAPLYKFTKEVRPKVKAYREFLKKNSKVTDNEKRIELGEKAFDMWITLIGIVR